MFETAIFCGLPVVGFAAAYRSCELIGMKMRISGVAVRFWSLDLEVRMEEVDADGLMTMWWYHCHSPNLRPATLLTLARMVCLQCTDV